MTKNRVLTPQVMLGTRVPAFKRRLPLHARSIAHDTRGLANLLSSPGPEGEFIEQRVYDVSWHVDDDRNTLAIGTTLSLLPEGRLETFDDERLAATLCGRGAKLAGHRNVAITEGETVPSVVVSTGSVFDPLRSKRLLVPLAPTVVFQMVVAFRSEFGGSLAGEKELETLFDTAVQSLVFDAGELVLGPYWFVSSRLAFEAAASMAYCDGLYWDGIRAGSGSGLVRYFELPLGHFEAAKMRLDDFALDSRGRLRFTRAAERSLKPVTKRLAVGGINEPLPINFWSNGTRASFAFVRDGVFHNATLDDASPAEIEAIAATIRFHEGVRNPDELIDGPARFTEATLFQPMPEPFLQQLAASSGRAGAKAKRKRGARGT